MKRGIVLAVMSVAVFLACFSAHANTFRIGPLVGVRGGSADFGVGLGLQFKDAWWGDFKYSYFEYKRYSINTFQPELVYRAAINDKLEWYLGAGPVIMTVSYPGRGWDTGGNSSAGGGGLDVGASWRIADAMLASTYIEYVYASGSNVQGSFLGLGLRLDFELGKK